MICSKNHFAFKIQLYKIKSVNLFYPIHFKVCSVKFVDNPLCQEL